MSALSVKKWLCVMLCVCLLFSLATPFALPVIPYQGRAHASEPSAEPHGGERHERKRV